ncbi:cellulose binding domain-containing protein [Nocardiopsis halophila]|uniref:cellulose binding domain-containing protein n=1 Tax=Nocardiopsis halophila TaxID=141692 RepID=UPI00034D440A|nr:cellulose binding domain-containing protein [Nocardiopsis halophila]
MGRNDGSGKARRGAHRSEPEQSGPLQTVGIVLGSTVPKKVRPPRLLSVLLLSGVTLGLVLFGYSTTQIYLRFSEPPVEHGTSPSGGPAGGPSAAPGDGTGGGEARAEQEQGTGGADGSGDGGPGEAGRESAAGEPAAMSYTTVEASSSNFTGRVTLTNTGADTLDGWELVLGFDGATVTSAWDVEWEATGDGVVARAPDWGDGLAPGESVEVNFTAEGTAQAPSTCVFNGESCSL